MRRAFVTFVLLARSRRREYAADARTVEVTGDPEALASGLETVHAAMTERLRLQGLLPTDGALPDPHPLYRLLSTHPAIESRVARLRSSADP